MARSNQKFFAVMVLAVVAILIGSVGIDAVMWLAGHYPAHHDVIRLLGIWLVVLVVCLLCIYPMLSMYGLVRPASESWKWILRKRNGDKGAGLD